MARRDLYTMVPPIVSGGGQAGELSYTYGSNVVLCGILSSLAIRPVIRNGQKQEDVADLYRKAQQVLSLNAGERPDKHLLRSIRFGREELDAIQRLYAYQKRAIEDLVLLCADSTYTDGQRSKRRDSQHPFARAMERSVVSNLNAESKRIDELAKTFSRLEEQTAWSIEIYDSDHNKAIFVFGVVTIVFLPLSFFTSYFGMNTVDIREMGSDQADFWTVALPISVGVVGLTMVVAYFGDRIRNWFSQFANQHLLATPSWTAAEAATAATTSPAERITASPHLSQPSSGSGINGGADIFRFPLLESESSSRLLSRSWRATGVEPSTSLKSEEEEDQEEDGEYEKEDQEDGEYEEVDD
ncbi:hypothetical protein VTH82DRAFT_6533 [Thermothelomyces myriococcoides]